jgi:sugar O-acyltransferase (sialic acid O-acetyltransferase NeuD family)
MRKVNNLNILGSEGHAKVVIESGKLSGFKINFVHDDNLTKKKSFLAGFEIKVPISSNIYGDSILAIGDNIARKSVSVELVNVNWVVIIHPSVIISEDFIIGEGTVIIAGVIIKPGTKIGKHFIINTGACIDHECEIDSFSHIAPGAILLGNVKVWNKCFIGANSVIKQGISICDNVTIGLGAVVTKDITEPGTYVGSPARKLEKL